MDPGTGPSWRALALAGIVLAAVAVGWYHLSVQVIHSSPRTAAGESVGVILALLVFVSFVGALHRRHTGVDD